MPAFLPAELPVRARTRHHVVVLFRVRHKWVALGLLVLLVLAYYWPVPFAVILGLLVGGTLLVRWQVWHAERIYLTGKRIVRVEGVPETTRSESSLRVDRISGTRLVEPVLGKILGYGTIELEAPGDHPEVHRLATIAHPHSFYLTLREMVYGEGLEVDPDDGPPTHDTVRLPHVDPPRDRFGRRRY